MKFYHFVLSLKCLYTRMGHHFMRKPAFCICGNEGADQLCSNWEVDQRLCFHYMIQFLDFLNPKFPAYSHLLCSFCVESVRKPHCLFSQNAAHVFGPKYSALFLQSHLSIVKNFKDLSMDRCEVPHCCRNMYHCQLCPPRLYRPTYKQQLIVHYISHWKTRVPYKSK